MTEEELLYKWDSDRPIYEAWGNHVVEQVVKSVGLKIAPMSADVFLRIPPKYRLKAHSSILEKAFYRNKGYTDPYAQITDKVGVRFVVLLSDHIRVVEDALVECTDWETSKDRDYEDEQNANPIQFDYAALHYVVRSRCELTIDSIIVPTGTPCEIQVKTILQHAYSELTHDTIYKPKVDATSKMKRTAAKSMALIEATNDYFLQVTKQVQDFIGPNKSITNLLSGLYRFNISREPEVTRAEGLILSAYSIENGVEVENVINGLLSEKAYLIGLIAHKAQRKLLFRQPSILLVYAFAATKPSATKRDWPLTPEELKPIYTDLGLTFDRY